MPPLRIAGDRDQLSVLLDRRLLGAGDRVLAWFFASTRTGKAMRACSINAEAAALQGIPVSRMLALSFALSAALGALAGMLVTPTQYTAFNVGVPFAISGFIAAIVGGFGRPLGALVGGILLGVAQSLAVVFFGAGFKNVAALSILLLFLFVRPDRRARRRKITQYEEQSNGHSQDRLERHPVEADPPRRRAEGIFGQSAATVALHRLMPGHEPRPHSHPHEQIAYIIEGRMMLLHRR